MAELTVSSGKLSPAFASSTYDYRVKVSESTKSILVYASISDPAASNISVNSLATMSGSFSPPISLNYGENPVEILLWSPGYTGPGHKYSIIIFRGYLLLNFYLFKIENLDY